MKENILKRQIHHIIEFIQKVVQKTGRKNIIIGWSGGIDSTVSLYLLAQALPKTNIHVLHLPYENSLFKELIEISNILNLPQKNIHEISIKSIVDEIWEKIDCKKTDQHSQKIRKGNIMARTRMIMLFDYAQNIRGLVCGTENKSEHLLGYYTRYGDQASDFEPIIHLYKTDIYNIAVFLGIPKNIIIRKPSANLWKGQTDEDEFGFSYHEADQVLKSVVDQKKSIKNIIKFFPNTKKIINRMLKNNFKDKVPYQL